MGKSKRKNKSKRRKRKRYDRAVGYRRHTIKRAEQKLGISFSDELRYEILMLIRAQKGERFVKLTNSRVLHEIITSDDRVFYPIYSKSLGEIVTLLDKDHAEKLFTEKDSPQIGGGRSGG